MSHYMIIQYLPTPLTGECINVGVIAYDKATQVVLVRGLTNWQRVDAFAGDISYVKSFVEKLAADKNFTIREAIHMATWCNSIQATAPRGSILPVDKLLDGMAKMFLVEPTE